MITLIRLGAVASALTLGACVTAPTWNRPGATAVDFEREKLQCQYEAVKATAGGGDFGMSTAIGAGIAEGMKQGELMNLCMKTKGWTAS